MRFFLSFKIDCKTGCKFRPLLWLVGKTVKLESENFTLGKALKLSIETHSTDQ